MTTPLCFLDTETTGLHHAREPWEIALIRREDGIDTETVFMLHVDVVHAQPQALEIGGFYRRHPLGIAVTNGEAYDSTAVTSRLRAAAIVQQYTRGSVLVVNNPAFDVPLLERLLLSTALAWSWHYRPIDIIPFAAGWLNAEQEYATRGRPGHFRPPFKSEEISAALGVTPPSVEERHTALGDARWVRDIYDALTEKRS